METSSSERLAFESLWRQWSILGSYAVKYGETLLPFIADGDSPAVPILASLMIVSFTGFNCWKWQQRSQAEADDFGGLI